MTVCLSGFNHIRSVFWNRCCAFVSELRQRFNHFIDFTWIGWIGISQVAVLASQEEAYREVLSRSDGVFLAAGPEETKSDYRRSMLRHQIAEDERKRCWDEPCEVFDFSPTSLIF